MTAFLQHTDQTEVGHPQSVNVYIWQAVGPHKHILWLEVTMHKARDTIRGVLHPPRNL